MTTARIHYLDWLKVLIVYGIVVFHVALVFSLGWWLVTDSERSMALSAFAGFCFPWGIPAMFLIAGADAWFGLRSRGLAHFVKARVTRLLVPFVAALVVLGPFQRYVTSHNPPPSLDHLAGSYVAFFNNFHRGFHLEWVMGYWAHLWFLAYLFAISVVCAPLIAWLRGSAGLRFSAEVARAANRRGGIYLVGAPLVVSQLLVRPFFPAYQSWADVATYTLVFLAGAVLFSTRAFEPAIRRDIRLLLITGVVGIAGVGVILLLSPGHVPPARSAPIELGLSYSLLWALDIWSWLMAVLYMGIRWLDFSNRFLAYAQESVLPVYVIHHPVVLAVASFVVTMGVGVWPKFVLILVSVFAVTLAVYELGVRRWAATRFLFGLKPRSAARPASESEARGSARAIAVARR